MKVTIILESNHDQIPQFVYYDFPALATERLAGLLEDLQSPDPEHWGELMDGSYQAELGKIAWNVNGETREATLGWANVTIEEEEN